MANLNIIRKIAEEKKISLKEIAESAGVTQNGLQRILNENSTKIETLEKIAKHLEVPVSIFFEEYGQMKLDFSVKETELLEALQKEDTKLQLIWSVLALLYPEESENFKHVVKMNPETLREVIYYKYVKDVDSWEAFRMKALCNILDKKFGLGK